MPLQTRRPTGRPAYPLILVEGEEKAGKTYASLSLSADPRVGRTFVFDLGDGTADEYAALGPYEIVETDGTFRGLVEGLRAAAAEPMVDGRPNVIVLDSGTQLWESLKSWADARARRSHKAKKKLAEDPDAEIDTSMNLWNDAKGRWAEAIQILRTFPGIGIVTAQGREVSKVQNGAPVAGQTEWSVAIEKSTPAVATAWVRITRDPRRIRLVGLRSLSVDVGRGIDLDGENPLASLVFDTIGAGAEFDVPADGSVEVGIPRADAMGQVLDWVRRNGPDLGDDEAKAEARRIWTEGLRDLADAPEIPEHVVEEVLAAEAVRREAATPPQDAQEAVEEVAGGDHPQDAVEGQEGDEGPQYDADWIATASPAQIREALGRLDLPTSGAVAELRARLAEAVAPF